MYMRECVRARAPLWTDGKGLECIYHFFFKIVWMDGWTKRMIRGHGGVAALLLEGGGGGEAALPLL